METEKRKVASFFIENVPGFGIIVGNEGEAIDVPAHLIEDYETRGLIGKKRAAKSDPLDHDNDGKKGGAAPADDAVDAAP